MKSEILSYFPPGYEMRPGQKEILEKIGDAVGSGYRHIILCAPTGLGKSHIGITFARWCGSSSIITAQKVLQDQYSSDFTFLANAKGKSNYPCITQCEIAGVSTSSSAAKTGEHDHHLSCERGACWWYSGGMRKEWCQCKPAIDDFVVTESGSVIEPLGYCHYYTAKYLALLSKHSIYNYHAFFHFSRSKEMLKNSECIVADEAHEIEDALAMYSSVPLPPEILARVGVSPGSVTQESLPDLLRNILAEYRRMEQEGRRGDDASSRYSFAGQRVSLFLREARTRKANIAMEKYQTKRGTGLKLSPVSTSHIAKRMFSAKKNLYMSGTIHPDIFIPAMGLDSRDCAYIEHKEPPFSAEARRIEFLDTVRLRQTATDSDYERAYAETLRLVRMHARQKGLVLCTSIRQADVIAARIGARAIAAYGAKREDAVKRHIESPEPTVLVSPSLWVGLDLYDSLSRFCVILKTPFPSLADIRTKMRAEQSQLWYRYQTLVKIIQGAGRSVRSRDDHAVTYVVDSAASELVRSMRSYIPAAYADVFCR